MELTVVQIGNEGLIDDELPPLVYEGHLTEEQCYKIALEYGSGYAICRIARTDNERGAVFYANYGNDENAKIADGRDGSFAGLVDDSEKGDLELWFYHVKSHMLS